ncbi:heterogeneous nuclear ribonucleoprotein M isoform X1 [Coregonus clupeaformis]|uniref:RRM domain-containing protein n=2 Tax=Coregonus TaxID=27772 RepID=A0AAN8M9T1_9TELE|nr:heterogeneous nuclear ribonucleoprotein M isoform X1 [Coregonus clupeaformis]
MSTEAAAPEKPGQGEMNGKAKHEPNARKERPQKRGGGRFEPYGNPSKRYRVFVSNIPYDVKWQALKDLMKEKVGEVTYVEHLMDGEGKSRGCAVVEFRTEELMKKAVEKVNKHNLNGRPLKVKEDPDGVIAQRDAHRSQGGGGGGGGPPGGHGGMNMGMDRMNMERMNMDRMGPGPGAPPMVNIPPSLMNNSNIPNEIIHGLQAGKIGSTVFVANLDYKVGWKKLKEVFGMAGVVVRTDILEDKDGNSRGMGTVTFDMPIEAVQAVSMFNGQLLFNRVMHVKLDEKSLPKGDFAPPERPPALPRGLSGIGLGLGPGGQPIDATALNRGGGGMGNMGPGGMDGMGFGGGMGRMGGMDNFGGGMNNMERFGPSGMGRMNEMDRGIGGSFDREFARNEMGMSRNNFGESFERGMGSSLGMDRMSSGMDRLGGGMDRLGGMERMGMERMDRVSDLDRLGGSGFDRMGSGLDRLGPSMDRLGSGLDRMSSSVDRLGPAGFDRLGPSSLERMPAGLDFTSPMGMADRMERMGTNFDRMGPAGIDRFPTTGLDRMGSTMDRMGAAGVGGQFDRPAEMERGGFGGNGFGGAGAGGPGANARKGCQIFVRNLPFDFTWKMLKDNFNTCGIVQYADIKMENGKSKGCGVVRFDNPETAERACRTMNGYRLNGREIDVRIDRNA